MNKQNQVDYVSEECNNSKFKFKDVFEINLHLNIGSLVFNVGPKRTYSSQVALCILSSECRKQVMAQYFKWSDVTI